MRNPGSRALLLVTVTVALGVEACSSSSSPSVDSLREACTFKAGAKVADTLGFSAADRARAKIGHVVVIMKENRAFDHMFGRLPAHGRPEVDGIPTDFANVDKAGVKVTPFHQVDTCVKLDPKHQFAEMHVMANGGKMDGFVKNAADTAAIKDTPASTDGHFVLGYYDSSELPFYYWLADQYSIADRYFASALSGTWSNRIYLVCGSSYGVKNTVSRKGAGDFVPPGTKTIFDQLDVAGVSWGIYTDDQIPLSASLFSIGWTATHKGVAKLKDFIDGANTGTLPAVSFVDGLINDTDEHPPADVQKGEKWTRLLYQALVKSPLWLEKNGNGIAAFYTYDEGGGYFDHVPPPKACIASPDQAEFDTLGIRVSLMVISPYARPKYVSHLQHQHTSILRFIELLYDLPAFTARDANSDALLDMFDFATPALASPPDAPDAGTGGCR